MAAYDGHAAKRQRTDNEGSPRINNQGQNFYNYSPRGGGAGGGGGGGGAGGGGGGGGPPGGRGPEDEKPNNILLMTVLNPAYPITVEVIHTICSPSGKVARIVIFKKNGVQAMVEFDNLDSAKRAKQSLNGADIYSGCCTLKIEYAKPTRLNVYKNDNESFDYTNPNLGKTASDRPALLQEPRGFGPGPGPYRDGNRGPPGGPGFGPGGEHEYEGYGARGGPAGGQYGGAPAGGTDQFPPQDRYGGPPPGDRYGSRDGYDGRREGPPRGGGGGGGYTPMAAPPPGGSSQQGCVLMVYGLNAEKINAEKLFNLFCLYGNVVRVKFLKSKEGCAMIQMGDPVSVERAIANLNNAYFFGTKVQLGFSKQVFLNDVRQPFQLPDGTSSFEDFVSSRNNRFTSPESASKNRIQPPSKMLHFFNAPFGIKEDEMKKLFEDTGSNPPKTVKLFTSKTERSSSGLLEFEGIPDAMEGLTLANHLPIPNPNGKFPYILKLCFSSAQPGRF